MGIRGLRRLIEGLFRRPVKIEYEADINAMAREVIQAPMSASIPQTSDVFDSISNNVALHFVSFQQRAIEDLTSVGRSWTETAHRV